MDKEKGLEIPEKLQDMDVLIMVKRLIEQKKLELENLNHQILLAKSAITSLQQQQVNMENTFNQQMFQEKQELENKRNQKENDWNVREERVSQIERDCGKKVAELEGRELEVIKKEEERKQLVNERIEVERIKNQELEKLQEADNRLSEANSKEAVANIKEQEARQAIAKSEQLNSAIVVREDSLKIKQEDLDKSLKNLQELKKEIDPKIIELSDKEKSIDKKLNEIQVEDANISLKIEEDKKILVSIEEKLEQLRKKEIDIATREEDLLRKFAILKTEK